MATVPILKPPAYIRFREYCKLHGLVSQALLSKIIVRADYPLSIPKVYRNLSYKASSIGISDYASYKLKANQGNESLAIMVDSLIERYLESKHIKY